MVSARSAGVYDVTRHDANPLAVGETERAVRDETMVLDMGVTVWETTQIDALDRALWR